MFGQIFPEEKCGIVNLVFSTKKMVLFFVLICSHWNPGTWLKVWPFKASLSMALSRVFWSSCEAKTLSHNMSTATYALWRVCWILDSLWSVSWSPCSCCYVFWVYSSAVVRKGMFVQHFGPSFSSNWIAASNSCLQVCLLVGGIEDDCQIFGCFAQ